MKNKLVKKIRRAKKAVNGVLVQVSVAIAAFAPDFSDEYKIGVGIVGSVFTGLVIYYTENEEE